MKRIVFGIVGVMLTIFICSCQKTDAASLKPGLDASIQAASQIKPVPRRITSEEADVNVPRDDQSFTDNIIYVSEFLQEAMEKYKDKDVLFRVIVEVPRTQFGGTDCFVFAVQEGASNISSCLLSSDVRLYRYAGGAYFMDINCDTLTKMIEHRGYVLRLAPPERFDGYGRKVSDSLAIALNQMEKEESIHVAVVSRVDRGNLFLSDRKILNNVRYNEDLYQPLTGDLTDQSVIDYIDGIVERNGLTDKRVFNPQHSDVDVVRSTEYSSTAGFEAILTKGEILALTEDPDIKVIHPMPNTNN